MANGMELRANARFNTGGILAGGATVGRIESGAGDTNNPNTHEVQTVGPALGQPVTIVTPRLVRFGVNVNF